MQRGPKTAFTLVELLVVIAIVAVIAAILFPVLGAARDKARQAACFSNLMQIGDALNMYLQDYDERLPDCCSWAAPTHGWTELWSATAGRITSLAPRR
jgi:prepilin-type N-terminal cleavage/methylation domain-containing protein